MYNLKRSFIKSVFFCLAVGGQPGCGLGSKSIIETQNGESIKILFIGNSLTYTNDLPGLLVRLAEESKAGLLEVTAAAFPNYGLEDHWNRSGGALEALRKGGWDLIIMQQGPSGSEGRPSLLSYSKLFAEEAEKVGARAGIYMVWPAQVRLFDFDLVSESHRMAAENIQGYLFPVGEAWRAAWRRDSNLALYGPDAFHPSIRGTYLAAIVILEQITDLKLENLSLEQLRNVRQLDLIDSSEFSLLNSAAAEANSTFAREILEGQ